MVRCWVNRLINWGNKVLSRVKDYHEVLKNKLEISRGDIKDVCDKFYNLLRRQYSEITAAHETQNRRAFPQFSYNLFLRVAGKISVYTLDLTLK